MPAYKKHTDRNIDGYRTTVIVMDEGPPLGEQSYVSVIPVTDLAGKTDAEVRAAIRANLQAERNKVLATVPQDPPNALPDSGTIS